MLGIGSVGCVGADPSLLVAGAVARRVATQPEVGGRADQNALGQDRHGAGQDEPVEEDVAAVHPSVGVRVFEYDDAPVWLFFAFPIDVRHEAAHLDHIEESVIVPIHGHRVDYEGLGRDELDAKARRDAERGERLVGGEHGRRWDLDRGEDLLWAWSSRGEVGQREKRDRAHDYEECPLHFESSRDRFFAAARASASGRFL
jgi:hypothetical protein